MPRTTVWVGLSVGCLLAAADAARPGLGYLTPGFTADRRAAARAARQARHFPGNGSFSQAWQQGQALTLDDAIAYTAPGAAGASGPRPDGPASHPPN